MGWRIAGAWSTLCLGEPFALFRAVALVLVIGGIWLAQRGARA